MTSEHSDQLAAIRELRVTEEDIAWLESQIAETERCIKAREQAEATWSGGDSETWRGVGCKLTKAGRSAVAEKEGRIADKYRCDLECLKKLLALANACPWLLDAAERGLEGPLPECYACQRCGRRDGLDAVIDNASWARITDGVLHPSGEVSGGKWNLLCLWCIDELASELGIETGVSLHFAGRSLWGARLADPAVEAVQQMLTRRVVEVESQLTTLRAERDAAVAERDRLVQMILDWDEWAEEDTPDDSRYTALQSEARKLAQETNG